MPLKPPMSTLFPYTTLFRSRDRRAGPVLRLDRAGTGAGHPLPRRRSDHGGSSASALSPVAWERIREPGLIWSAPREGEGRMMDDARQADDARPATGRPDWATIPNAVTLLRFLLLAPVCWMLADGGPAPLDVILLLVGPE